MRSDPAKWLVEAWHQLVEPNFRAGYICNETSLIAEIYRYHEVNFYQTARFWLLPKLDFAPTEGPIFDQLSLYQIKQGLKEQTISMILTDGQEVVAGIETQFLPHDYVNFRPSLRKLSALYQLLGKEELLLGYGSTQKAYPLAKDALLAYAVITRKNSLALQERTLRQDFTSQTFPKPLLQLLGAVESKEAIFTYQWLE